MPPSEDEIKQHLSTITARIKVSFEKFCTEITNKIVNEQESQNLYYELETKTKGFLEEVFGEETDIRHNKSSSPFLHYRSKSDAAIFNYWSHKGEAIESPMESETGKWRDNLFYKGERWSAEEQKSLFYKFFEPIRDALQGEAPVDFFTRHGVDCRIRYLKIIGLRLTEVQQIEGCSRLGQITIPILSSRSEAVGSIKYRALLKLISGMRKNNSSENRYEHFISSSKGRNKKRINNLRDSVQEAYTEAEEEDSALLDAVKKSFIAGLTDDTNKKRELEDIILPRDVFNVVTAYQYYDHPYDIHMFLPPADDNKLYSCLVISVQKGKSEIVPYKDSLINLAGALGEIKTLEHLIWINWNKNLPIYYKWKQLYEKYLDQYQRFSDIAMSICLAICKKEGVEVFLIPSRLKAFDSFYNKIVSRANGRDEDYSPANGNSMSDADMPSLRETTLNYKISNPSKENAKIIFEELKDVLGLRIICLIPPEPQKIEEHFECFQTKGEIASLNVRPPTGPHGYRSMHITFALGKEKCKIYELEDMQGRKCEIQIRTILDQGWADISHKFSYKPGVPQLLAERIRREIKRELEKASADLARVDGTFDRIVNRVKEITAQANL